VRNEVHDLYLFRNLAEVREIVSQWRRQYNEDRPHDALGGLPPPSMHNVTWKTLLLNCLLDGGAYDGTSLEGASTQMNLNPTAQFNHAPK
jgi:Integrase core domain